MKVVFLSNYFNHHQRFLSDSLAKKCKFTFIETKKIPDERIKLGWGGSSVPDYVMNYDNQKEDCDKLISEADVVLYGSAPHNIIKNRLKAKKLVIRYSERIYKTPLKWYMYPYRLLDFFMKWGRYKSAYLFCASAYAYSDYIKTGTFRNKAFKWGYFPECKKYENVDALIEQKQKNSILWCARFIGLKHPEFALELAKKLKNDGYKFTLNMIGIGELYDEIAKKIKEAGLENEVKLLGSMKPDEVRQHMEKNEIFIATSDRNEGWGAVLNEAMNSACAVVSNSIIGSAPYLIENGVNGLLYHNDKNSDELTEKVKLLLDDKNARKEYSKKAYETIVNEWNAENAADKFIALAKVISSKEKNIYIFEKGVCSRG